MTYMSRNVNELTGLQPSGYMSLLQLYLGNDAYYLGPNGLPMISTYSSGGCSNETFNSESSNPIFISITDIDTL